MQKNQNKRSNYALTVTDSIRLSPTIQRITLQGEVIAHFGKESEGHYIKLLFTPDGSTDIASIAEDERPVMRTYTIREFDTNANSIVIDFVRHITHDLSCGFAARWSVKAKVGDKISIAGPGKSQGINQDADWLFLAADMTSLPALAVTLADLNPDAKGYAVIEINESEDIQLLAKPNGVDIIWAVGEEENNLVETVKAQTWLEGQCSVWCACEFESMRALRQYFRNDKNIDREFIYISSYWKNGVSEDGHKVLKRQDAEVNQ